MTPRTVDAEALRELVAQLTTPLRPRPAGRPVAVSSRILSLLADVVPADLVVFNDLAPRRQTEWAASDSLSDDESGEVAGEDGDPDPDDAFFDYFWTSPCSHPDRSGDWESVTTISDLCSLREWKNSPMYDVMAGMHVAFDRELLVPIASPPGHSRRIRFLRLSGRDFDDTDRSLAALVRPHLLAHLHALDLQSRGVAPLTARQRQLLSLLADGRTNAQIGHSLGISPQTVRTHLQQVYARLHVASRGEAVALLRPPGAATPLAVQQRPPEHDPPAP
jgi:DNA-binding CsgD family transcriptional regulator